MKKKKKLSFLFSRSTSLTKSSKNSPSGPGVVARVKTRAPIWSSGYKNFQNHGASTKATSSTMTQAGASPRHDATLLGRALIRLMTDPSIEHRTEYPLRLSWTNSGIPTPTSASLACTPASFCTQYRYLESDPVVSTPRGAPDNDGGAAGRLTLSRR